MKSGGGGGGVGSLISLRGGAVPVSTGERGSVSPCTVPLEGDGTYDGKTDGGVTVDAGSRVPSSAVDTAIPSSVGARGVRLDRVSSPSRLMASGIGFLVGDRG